jgi:hypothetical protein
MTQTTAIECGIERLGGDNIRNNAAAALFRKPDKTVAVVEPPRFIVDAVERQLGQAYVAIDRLALDLGLTAATVIEALDVLERQHGIGHYLEVSSRDNASVRLRSPVRHGWLHTMPRRARQMARPCVEGNPPL